MAPHSLAMDYFMKKIICNVIGDQMSAFVVLTDAKRIALKNS